MSNNFANKTSLRVADQLPGFVNEQDYPKFIAFIQAYYEWMEQQDSGNNKEGVIYGTQNLPNYMDVDYVEPGSSYNKFIDYYVNDFLPNFPKEALTDKSKFIKIAKKLYEVKGTPASFNFLFRALYNTDAQIFLTRDAVFKASDGKWYVSKSLRLATNDETFLSIQNLRIIGLTSKSIATVERGISVGNRIELYISNIERLFESGETIQVVDNSNQPIYFLNGKQVNSNVVGSTTLSAKILGSISTVNINSKKRGQLYTGRSDTYSGDPVIFYGGLNSANGIGATAFVNEITLGSLRAITVADGSYGYREDPNTYIQITGGGGSGAIANVGSVDPTTQIDVNFVPKDYLTSPIRNMTIGGSYTAFSAGSTISAGSFIVGQKYTILTIGGTPTNFTLIGAASNTIGVTFTATGAGTGTGTATFVKSANTSIANSLSFTAFSTFTINSVILNNGGGGYSSLPIIRAKSLYDTTDPQTTENLKVKGQLGSLGILGPIRITTSGTGYANGDIINFIDGKGNGANANVTVNATGAIISTQYRYANNNSIIQYPKGGLGYSVSHLPTLNVSSASGTGAVLNVLSTLGESAVLIPVADERGIGAITSFIIENFGEDYISAPNVSLRVRDLVVKNVNPSNIITTGEMIYQGANVNTFVFRAFVDSIRLLVPDAVPTNSTYLLRTYNYASNTKTDLKINATDRQLGSNIHLDLVTTYETFDSSGNYLFKSGVRTYGNGAAEATAKFLNGLIIGQGQYLKDDGFPSSFQVLQNQDYNNFTYKLTVQKSFDAYKDVLFKLLHPSGTKVIPVNALKSEETIDIHRESYQSNSHTLSYHTGSTASNAAIYTNFTSMSNNIVKFDLLAGANIGTFIFPGSRLSINSNSGPNVYSQIISVNYTSNTAVIQDNVFSSFANVATANVTSSNNRINIRTVTNEYDIINNGEYSNTSNKMQDIVFAGDSIRVVSGSSAFFGTVVYVSYSNNVIFANTTIPFTSTTANVSVSRNITAYDGAVNIYNSLGSVFFPELITQSGQSITTQDGRILILG